MMHKILLALALALLAAPALAQSEDPTVAGCEAKDPASVIPACSAIINDQPDMSAYLFEAYVNRGNAELEAGQVNDALADDTQAVTLNPNNANIRLNRARAFLAARQLPQAIADATQSIALNPGNADAFFLRGKAEGETGLLAADTADQTSALALNPAEPGALLERAKAYASAGKTSLALADISAELAANPRDALALSWRGGYYLAQNQPSLALPDLQQAVAADPGNIDAGVSLGLCYGEQGDWAKEISQLTAMLQTGRLLPRGAFLVFVSLSDAYYNQGQFNAAITDASNAIAIAPSIPGPYTQRARAYEKEGDDVSALADDSKAVSLAPKNPEVYFDRAGLYEDQSLYALAIPDDSAALALDPKNAVVWNNRCWDRAHTGALQQALADCQKSLAIQPNDPNTLDSTGFVYLKLHNGQQSISYYSAALARDPTLASSLYGRAMAEQAEGKKAAAAADFAAAARADPNIAKDFGS